MGKPSRSGDRVDAVKLGHHLPVGIGVGVLGLVVATAVLLEVRSMKKRYRTRLYTEVGSVPHRKVALVLGCLPALPDGRRNRYFEYRVDAAAELFRGGRVDYLLVSGDDHRRGCDEPGAMREALMQRRVPEERIVLDGAGFRTLDSVVRAKTVFGQTQVLVVSQRFHAERALYLAAAHGLDAIGFCAADAPITPSLWLREPLARLRAVLDVHGLHTRPRCAGERVTIGG
jgi:SanA protein